MIILRRINIFYLNLFSGFLFTKEQTNNLTAIFSACKRVIFAFLSTLEVMDLSAVFVFQKSVRFIFHWKQTTSIIRLFQWLESALPKGASPIVSFESFCEIRHFDQWRSGVVPFVVCIFGQWFEIKFSPKWY